MKRLPRVGWILAGDLDLASSRIQGYRVKEYLSRCNHECHIVAINASKISKGYSKSFFDILLGTLRGGYQAIVFQKPDWMMFKLSELLRLNGVRTVAVQCDPFPGDYERYFDLVIVTTDKLRDTLKLPQARVIDDMLEVPTSFYKRDYNATSQRLRLVWIGQGMPTFTQDFFRQLLSHPLVADTIEVVTIGRGDWVTLQWSLDTVYNDILSCDIAVIPLPETEWASSKSTNRLTQFMALGMPTIVSPIDSYKRIYANGSTFALANSIQEFANAIVNLKDSRRRMMLGEAAREFAWKNYSPEVIGPTWENEILNLLEMPNETERVRLHTRLMGSICGALARRAGARITNAAMDPSVRH